MSWLLTLLIGVLCGGLGLVVAGFIAALCTEWYRVSNFEGAAGYFVVAIALGGAVVGCLVGVVTSRFVDVPGFSGFLRGSGWSALILLGLGGGITLLCRLLADVPPTIAGATLDLEVEVLLPRGDSEPPSKRVGAVGLTLGSVLDHQRRASRQGDVFPERARLEGGRWVLPGSVFLFTGRGMRSIDVVLGGTSVAGYLLPVPAAPGRAEESWSRWFPTQSADGTPWPETKSLIRFRVVRQEPAAPPPDPALATAAAFAALSPTTPLIEWIRFGETMGIEGESLPESPTAMRDAVQAMVAARQSELATLVRSGSEAERTSALAAAVEVAHPGDALREALTAEGDDLLADILAFNAMATTDPKFAEVHRALRSRFNEWKLAWWSLIHRSPDRSPAAGRRLVQSIHDAALRGREAATLDATPEAAPEGSAARQNHTEADASNARHSLDEIVVNARVILEALPAAEPATATTAVGG